LVLSLQRQCRGTDVSLFGRVGYLHHVLQLDELLV